MESCGVDVDGVVLHVGVSGAGPDVVTLSGGPGCVQYLEQDALSPRGHRSWFPEPRGVGRSGGGPHSMDRAIEDLEAIRIAVGVERWTVLGHSWGCDLAVRYALDHPDSVLAVVGIAGHGLHKDRTWSEAYEAGRSTARTVEIDWEPDVHESLWRSFTDWIHRPDLWRRIADCAVPMRFVAAGNDPRPSWPMEQIASLLPDGRFSTVPGVDHDFWAFDPAVWVATVGSALADLGDVRRTV
jgi:proline iminopeptidase